MSKEETAQPKAEETPDRLDGESIDFFVSILCRVANRSMLNIFKDDRFYKMARYAHVSPYDAKRLFFYGCARQVFKAGTALIKFRDLIREKKPPESSPQMNLIIESTVDEQQFWIRKLIELLTLLINFDQADPPELFRIYLSAENLDQFAGRQKDEREFYSLDSGNVASSIAGFKERVESDAALIGKGVPWFINKKRLKNADSPVFASFRERFKRALSRASDDEAGLLGVSYHRVFSLASLSIHPSVGSSPKELRYESIEANISFISLLGQHAISRINALIGFEEHEDIKKLLGNRSVAPRLMERFKRQFQHGDLVMAQNDLAEIVESKTSQFGYTSFKVKFLSKPPLPELPEDWLSSIDIYPLMPKAAIREFMSKNFQEMVKRGELTADDVRGILSQSDDVLMRSVRKTFMKFDEMGVLIPMIRQEMKDRRMRNMKAKNAA